MKRLVGCLGACALFAAALPLAAHPPGVGEVETLVLFNPGALEAPESLIVRPDGTILVSLALTGEIRQIDPDGTQSPLAFLPIGPPLTPCGGFIGILGALAEDPHGNVYAAVAACDPANRGVWKVTPDGDASLVANLPPTALPNGVVYRRGRVYVADSLLGVIWTVPAAGGTATVWLADPALAPAPGAAFPGANGLQEFRNELYVSNSDAGTILAIRFRPDGSAGALRVHAALPDDLGCDDFAFDVLGNLYCTTDPFNRLLRIFPHGGFETLLTAADGLDGPTSAVFGPGRDRFHLYVGNAAFPFFTTTFRPSLMRLRVAIPGVPVR